MMIERHWMANGIKDWRRCHRDRVMIERVRGFAPGITKVQAAKNPCAAAPADGKLPLR